MKKNISFLLVVLSVCFGAVAQNYPAKPSPAKLVNDFTNTISASEASSLEATLVAFDNKSSTQIAVVLVASTQGTDVVEYATELGRQWGIGNKQNNGVLLLVAKDDRKLAIVPGYGLEGKLPDAVCQAIIDKEIVPNFKRGEYFTGVSNGANAIMQAAEGAYQAPEGYGKRGKGGGNGYFLFIVIIIIVLIILNSSGGGGGGMVSRRGYRGLGGFPIIFPGGGGSGGGSSSGGGGGFGGFGGGSFGGGGSSGSW